MTTASGPSRTTAARDDGTIIWWDPTATGEDETGNEGVGMYRFANGGERYTLGNFPESPEEAGLFDVENSVTVYEQDAAGGGEPRLPAAGDRAAPRPTTARASWTGARRTVVARAGSAEDLGDAV